MYISEVKISGIRGFSGSRSVDLKLTRPDGSHAGWTVLAGRNGSGKTTLLRALALVMAGPSTARGLVPDFEGWVSDGLAHGFVKAMIVFDADKDRFVDSQLAGKFAGHRHPKNRVAWFSAQLNWSRRVSGDSERHVTRSSMGSRGETASRGPWADDAMGWFFAGYGPFRRIIGGSAEAQRLMLSAGPVQRLATLFHEDASLAESVGWLIDLHLQRLEQRPGAEEKLAFVIDLLNDGLLPDGFRVEKVDREGLWAERSGQVIPLRELSDGYRTVTALVLDLVRQLINTYESSLEALDRLIAGEAPIPVFIEESGDRPVVRTPGVVLIDEIDAHLHVSWQKKIGPWLTSHFPAMQFIVTSHSPYICQSADPGGLIRLPGIDEDVPPRVVDEELYERVVYGSGDDALLTDLFGVDSPYSGRAEEMRRRLTVLERAVLRGRASAEEQREYERLRETLTSSLAARVDEVAARIFDIP
ncbi:AAA family ATPase [Planomonospora sp. ID82291]|uniref:AAA family ATPase n=1 Tax=Planomonospora sp. ID82291 TaxID=2738136 RepID=UPI0018C363D6|nr:AAA family ATPase [Planomonospora sp. ID82291]MBG0816067.1 AAA family ATPase [Planomonospora sp. ID82291]